VSLPTDIIQLVGTGSVPVVVGGTVLLGVFELGERLASQRAKDALSKWLVSFDVQKARALPDGTQELFERIFRTALVATASSPKLRTDIYAYSSRKDRDHWSPMPVDRITSIALRRSASTKAPNCSGVFPTGSMPCAKSAS